MIYYSIFLVLSAFYLYLSRRWGEGWYLYLIPIAIAVFFSGFRYDAGNDYFTYYRMIDGYFDSANLEYLPRNLIAYARWTKNPAFFFFVTSLAYVLCISYFCKRHSDNPELSFLLFLLLPLSFLTSFGYVRQFIAIGFFTVSLSLLVDRRVIISGIFFFFAFLCHSSVILFLFVFLFYRMMSSRIYPWWIYFSLLTVVFPISQIITQYAYLTGDYAHYLLGEKSVDSGKKIGLLCVSFFFYFFAFRKRLNNKSDVFFFNVYFAFSFLYLLLMGFGEYVVRITYYLFPCAYILFVSTLSKRTHVFLIQIIGVILLGILTYYTTLYFASINPTRDFLTNYSFIF
ncbi:EpsG family protein [Serratia fonticola]|uniref:EpsG family protein n=1 Tax=Serratia fonticola TaxID=47917 RepID=UPI003AAEAFA0